jgi:hypothetical protein
MCLKGGSGRPSPFQLVIAPQSGVVTRNRHETGTHAYGFREYRRL